MRLGDLDALKEELELSKYIIPNDLNRLLNSEINRCIEAIDNALTVAVNCKDCDGYEAGYSAGLKDAEKPTGKWIKIFSNPFTNGYVCSICGHRIQVTEQFLPKVTECEGCGADMRGEEV